MSAVPHPAVRRSPVSSAFVPCGGLETYKTPFQSATRRYSGAALHPSTRFGAAPLSHTHSFLIEVYSHVHPHTRTPATCSRSLHSDWVRAVALLESVAVDGGHRAPAPGAGVSEAQRRPSMTATPQGERCCGAAFVGWSWHCCWPAVRRGKLITPQPHIGVHRQKGALCRDTLTQSLPHNLTHPDMHT